MRYFIGKVFRNWFCLLDENNVYTSQTDPNNLHYFKIDVLQLNEIYLFRQGLNCSTEEALLDGTNPVPDTYFTASSEFVYTAYMARLDGSVDYWCPTSAEMNVIPPTFFLQVI